MGEMVLGLLSIQEAGPVARMGPVTSSSKGGLGSVSGMSPIIVRADSVEGADSIGPGTMADLFIRVGSTETNSERAGGSVAVMGTMAVPTVAVPLTPWWCQFHCGNACGTVAVPGAPWQCQWHSTSASSTVAVIVAL